MSTVAAKLSQDKSVAPEYRVLAGIIRQAESDARAGDVKAEQWLKALRRRHEHRRRRGLEK